MMQPAITPGIVSKHILLKALDNFPPMEKYPEKLLVTIGFYGLI
jgi:hypothetical protein